MSARRQTVSLKMGSHTSQVMNSKEQVPNLVKN